MMEKSNCTVIIFLIGKCQLLTFHWLDGPDALLETNFDLYSND